jgi:RND family efflux transporter MFP subunit
VGTASVRVGQVREEILLTGALKPKEQVDITSKITGRVEKIYIHVGDFVKRGQPIADLEDSELQQQVRRATAAQKVVEATLAQRRAELANARADLERAKQLVESGLLARQDYEAKQTSFRVFQAQIQLTEAQGEQAVAELNELKIRLEQMRILSPMDGQIAERFVDAGAVISPATPIARVVNLSTMITRANVPEREVSKLRIGNRALVRVDAFGERVFEGKVTRIGPVLDAATRSALVEVEIPNQDIGLRAEMFARVTLDLAAQRPALLVPRQALVYRGQQPGVYVLQEGRPTFREADPGVLQGEEIEIAADLRPGMTVITRGATLVSDGVPVKVVGGDDAGANTTAAREAPSPAGRGGERR